MNPAPSMNLTIKIILLPIVILSPANGGAKNLKMRSFASAQDDGRRDPQDDEKMVFQY